MSDDDALSRAVDALARYLVGGTSLSETLRHVAELTVDAIPPADFAGITLLIDGRPATGVFTDPEASEIDQAQYDTGRGPCVQAFDMGEVILIRSTNDDRRFPQFSRRARSHGIHSTLSMPLAVADQRLGALNLYSRRLDSFHDDEIAAATRFASQAAVVLANAHSYSASVELNQQLRTAMVSRETIDLARGIIIANTRSTADEAFQLLVDESQKTNTKLRDVANSVVATATRRRLAT
ncbi:MAG: hypothetical protein JWM12_3568 [Ilumatobacteraceae bacterium]|nr:hypothetical protein [Ilumatobacteraceae bacterium]